VLTLGLIPISPIQSPPIPAYRLPFTHTSSYKFKLLPLLLPLPFPFPSYHPPLDLNIMLCQQLLLSPSPLSMLSPPPSSPPLPMPPSYKLMPPPPLSITAASPKLSEATKAELNSRQIEEQAKIGEVRNGDVTPIMKPELAQVPSNNHLSSSPSLVGPYYLCMVSVKDGVRDIMHSKNSKPKFSQNWP